MLKIITRNVTSSQKWKKKLQLIDHSIIKENHKRKIQRQYKKTLIWKKKKNEN